jgi:hypothetical protein
MIRIVSMVLAVAALGAGVVGCKASAGIEKNASHVSAPR